MSVSPDYQARRHEFVINLYHALDFDEHAELSLTEANDKFREMYMAWAEGLKDAIGVQWIGVALEYNTKGALHVNGFVQWEAQTRMMNKKAQPGAGCKRLGLNFGISVRAVRVPDGLYDYVCGLGKHAGKAAEHRFSMGEYRGNDTTAKHNLVDVAIQDLQAGLTPGQIARNNPRAYFYHHRAIKALYAAWHEEGDKPDGSTLEQKDGNAPLDSGTITALPSQVSQMDDCKEEIGDAEE